MDLFSIDDLSKEYGEGSAKVIALKNICLSIPANKFVVILGASGSGKSTLLNMVGCMDKPTNGKISFYDQSEPMLPYDLTSFTKKQMTRQMFYLGIPKVHKL